uniref:Uncharacterized protein n=1 Tax=Oryza glumipatula TaxID=40148 RepID=A0A0D9ZY56_9ORYZ
MAASHCQECQANLYLCGPSATAARRCRHHRLLCRAPSAATVEPAQGMAPPLLSSPLASSVELWTHPSRARREPLPLAAGALEPTNTAPTRHHYSRVYHRG